MRAGACLLITAVLAAGCAAAPAEAPAPSSSAALVSDAGRLDDALVALEHVSLRTATTLRWTLPGHDDAEAEVARTALLHLWEDWNVTTIGLDGRFALMAIVPADAAPVADCGALPPAARAAFAARDGLITESHERLIGAYPAGWYHVLLVGAARASVSLTFGNLSQARLHEPLTGDDAAWIVFGRAAEPGRSHEVPLASLGRPWALWAAHRIESNGFDGGREHVVAVEPGCASASQPNGGSAFAGNEGRVAALDAYGGPSEIRVRGAYEPRVGLASPEQTTLEYVFATFRPLAFANATDASAPPDASEAS